MPAIHQFLAGFTRGDAISNEALVLQRIFRSWGCESELFCEARRILPELRRQARDVTEARPGPRDVALLHLSIGSPVNERFAALACRRALLYHNVTPSHFFRLINPATAYSLEQGRAQVAALAGAAEVNLADSRFNAGELEAVGYRDVRVLPLVLDLDEVRGQPDRGYLKRFRDGRRNIVFVGRCAPNKRLEDLLDAFHRYHRWVDPESRLIHVGSHAGTERYHHLLLARVRELGLHGSVVFAGSVAPGRLAACYAAADLFLCMSEHEGFCIPVLESMVHDVPVVAYAAGAVPETMDGAGVLFHRKEFEAVAELMGRLARPGALREAVRKGQRARVARYAARDLGAELKRHLGPLLG